MSDTVSYTTQVDTTQVDPFEDIDITVEKDINVDVDFTQSFNTDINYDKLVNIDVDIDVNVDIEGNFAQATWDVQAIGTDTLAEIDLVVLAVENTLSHISGSATAVASGDGDGGGGGGGGEEPPEEPPEPPPPSFPQWPQDISNVVLYFDDAGISESDLTGDGYVLVKIDNWPGSANDDLDNSLDDILSFLVSEGVIEDDSVFLGAAIKGGNQATAFFAPDGNNDADLIPSGAPPITTPPPQGQVDGPLIDHTYQYSEVGIA
jgi:hypothetical protein